MSYDYIFRCILTGDSGVGKTSICEKIVYDTFCRQNAPTIGVEYSSIKLDINNNIIKCQLWDTAGAERFRCITKSYYRNICLSILVFDLSNINSFNHVKYWMTEVSKNINPSENYKTLLIGNKSDKNRKVSIEEIQNFVIDNNILYVETSAKHDNLKQTFKEIITSMFYDEHFMETSTGISEYKKLLDNEQKKEQRDKCYCMIN
jgi:small GTP-binding protein